jgi:hypothetical protein
MPQRKQTNIQCQFYIEIIRGYMFYLSDVGCNQGLVSRMVVLLPEPFTNHILQLKAYNNKQVISEHALIVFVSQLMKKSNSK